MGKTNGFLETGRSELRYRDVDIRLTDYNEVTIDKTVEELVEQGGRCMECGTPFCHSIGCPIVNLIPEWNDAIWRGQWKEAFERLEITNNFPEFTGRVCPAPCETSCTLSINDAPVTIKQNERAIIEKAFDEGWVMPRPPRIESGKTVAVIGSGPAGLAAAQQLRRAGHRVSLFEKNRKIGGLLRYGIPDFKLDKRVIDRRIAQLLAEGVVFETGVHIGDDISIRYLRNKNDAILFAIGASQPRELPVPGRKLGGIHYAMNFLSQSNRRASGEMEGGIEAEDKTVLVIGGGDTGSDCIGTARRQGAKKVYQYEIMPKPMVWNESWNPSWPNWPNILRTTSSHKEGCEREWNIETLSFEGRNNAVNRGNFRRIEWMPGVKGARPGIRAIPGSDFSLDIDLVLLAMGFVHVEHSRALIDQAIEFDERGNIRTDNYHTSIEGLFAAGDADVGASLVVRALNHGRLAAQEINRWLMKN
ncbi:Glutamate synthase [NADPH] small chain [Olavius algarvensis spirochete endosymbiont]|uniref:glutamate synthase subunit beta n=1 Tax=Olavius algarvensis spirochete endosymbiont TaxID=260710 RepID=UPI00052DD0A8|nr:glutamate synthase subunit beta [Olavius algarvensis spirochete endosymbiont]KGM43223.1 glutamate synthase [Alkalispirochaeta odontotermitis]VDA99191.1 Glutamate synthase [NADPH] small chain [Olavius algarvensis spirochete endosymbiont]